MGSDFAGYRRKSWICVLIVLTTWAVVSFVLGIVFVNDMNEIHLWGVPAGFWIANQGSEIIFAVLVFLYGAYMSRLDRQHDIEE